MILTLRIYKQFYWLFIIFFVVESLNIAVLGSSEFLDDFGKRGTLSDIVLYDRKLKDRIFTFIAPISFPDKIQTLPQVLNMTNNSYK